MKLTSLLLTVVVAAGTAGYAMAAPLQVQSFANGRYVTGGVGTDEQAELRQLSPDFNLRIVTAQKPEGDYISDADVTISRGQDPILETTMQGPVLLAELPPGTYEVRVEVEGMPQERTVQLAAGARRDLTLHWDLPGS